MDTSSYFIKNKAIFGNYPCPEKIKDLIEIGVTIFVDLTYAQVRIRSDNSWQRLGV